jgi:hypothetical protein
MMYDVCFVECGLPRVVIGTRRADFGCGGEAIARLISQYTCNDAHEMLRRSTWKQHFTLVVST